MQFAWTMVPVAGIIVGSLVMMFAFRKRKRTFGVFDDIDGVLKQDWTRTGNIDFHYAESDTTSPQWLALRVEEKKVTENAMGQDITQLRWRLATLEEAKEVVAYWNAGKAERNHEFRALLKSA
jgi:hypothetical protein